MDESTCLHKKSYNPRRIDKSIWQVAKLGKINKRINLVALDAAHPIRKHVYLVTLAHESLK